MNVSVLYFLRRSFPFISFLLLYCGLPSFVTGQNVPRMPTPSRQVGEDTLFLCNHAVEQQWKNGEWKETVVKDWTFDDNHLLLGYLEKHWVENKLVPVSRFTNTNLQGHLSERIMEQWNDTLELWLPTMKESCLYDDKGNFTQSITYRWDGSEFVLWYRLLSSFDGEGKRIKTVSQEWKDGQWISDQVTEYKFNSQGNLLERSNLSRKDSVLVPDKKSSTVYDSLGREIETNNSENYRELTQYGVNGNSTERIIQFHNFGKWTNSDKTITKLDSLGNIIEIISQLYNSPPPTWKNAVRWVYGYKKVGIHTPVFATNNKEVEPPKEAQQFHLSHNFPNPFNATTQIQYTVPHRALVTLIVYDILGKEISVLVDETKDAGNYTVTWNGQNVASGAYFYRMVSEGFAETGKMCLVK